MSEQKNVLGEPLELCCQSPVTGFYRSGKCETGIEDAGLHVVCVKMTADFLVYSKLRGNDLSTPRPEFGFPGLKEGDCWCLCAARWQEAYDEGCAPMLRLGATHEDVLRIIDFSALQSHALDMN